MKILLLAACLLIITKVKAIDLEKVQTLKENLQKCEQVVGKIPGVPYAIRPDLLFCALKKEGYVHIATDEFLNKYKHTIDEHDEHNIKEIANLCNILTFDPMNCQKISFPCYQQARGLHHTSILLQNKSKEQILKFLQCSIINGLMTLIPA